jgi:hypothetical protein
MRPAVGTTSPSSSAAVLLPAPLDRNATVCRAGKLEVRAVEREPVAAGVSERDAFETYSCERRARGLPRPPARDAGPGVEQREHPPGHREAVRARVVSAPMRREGRIQREGEDRTVTPVATATSATPSVAAGSSTEADRKLTRSADSWITITGVSTTRTWRRR